MHWHQQRQDYSNELESNNCQEPHKSRVWGLGLPNHMCHNSHDPHCQQLSSVHVARRGREKEGGRRMGAKTTALERLVFVRWGFLCCCFCACSLTSIPPSLLWTFWVVLGYSFACLATMVILFVAQQSFDEMHDWAENLGRGIMAMHLG